MYISYVCIYNSMNHWELLVFMLCNPPRYNMELWFPHPRHTARCSWANSPWHCVQRPRSPPDSWPLWRCRCKELHTQLHLSHRWLEYTHFLFAGIIQCQIFGPKSDQPKLAIPAWTTLAASASFKQLCNCAPRFFFWQHVDPCGFLRTAETGTGGFCDTHFRGDAGNAASQSHTKIWNDFGI